MRKYFGGARRYNFPIAELNCRDIFTPSEYKPYINKESIESIEYERIYNDIQFEKYVPETNTYVTMTTAGVENRSSQFKFFIKFAGIPEPIIIYCEDPRKIDSGDEFSYKWLPMQSDSTNDMKVLSIFITNMTQNSVSYILSTLVSCMAFYINKHIVDIGEKVLHENICPVMQEEYSPGNNVVLFFPCLHSVSEMGYNGMKSSGHGTKCPICNQTIKSIKMITYPEFERIYEE